MRLMMAAAAWLLICTAAMAQSQAERLALLMSKDFASQSQRALGAGDRATALIRALQALPANATDADMKTYSEGYRALLQAMVSRSIRVPIQDQIQAAIDPSGRRIATISSRLSMGDGVGEPLKLWDTRTGGLIGTLMPLAAGANDVYSTSPPAFSPDGAFLVQSASSTGEVLVFDAQTGMLLRRLSAYPPRANYIKTAFSPDGTRLLTISDASNQVDLWDPATGARLASHRTGARGCRFNVVEGGQGSKTLVIETGSPGLCPPQRNLLYHLQADGRLVPLIDLSSLAPFQAGPFASDDANAARLLLMSETGGRVIDTRGQMIATLPISFVHSGFMLFARNGTALMAPSMDHPGRVQLVDFAGTPLEPAAEDGLALLHGVFNLAGMPLAGTQGFLSQYTGSDLPRNAALYEFVWTNLPAHIRDEVSANRVTRP